MNSAQCINFISFSIFMTVLNALSGFEKREFKKPLIKLNM